MVFPGIGRQAWVSGSLGGGTGRTADWDTYDGTADTAWQVIVDQTSTALSSSYDVLLNQNTIKKLGPTRAVIGMQNGSNGYVGLVNCDTDDATSLEITLSTAQRCTGELLVSGSVAMLHGNEDYGSLFPVSVGTTTLTEGSRITGLHTHVPQDSTPVYQHDITTSFVLENAPFTRHFQEISGANYNQAVTGWPANSKRNWLMLGSQALNEISGASTSDDPRNRHLFSPYYIENLDTLITSPSSALALPYNNTGYQQTLINICTVPQYGNGTEGYVSAAGTAAGLDYIGNRWSMTLPFWISKGLPTFNTNISYYTCVAWHASSHNYYPDDYAGPDSSDVERTFHFMFSQTKKQHLYFTSDKGGEASWGGHTTGSDFATNHYRQFVSGRKTFGTEIEQKLQYKMKAIQLANSVIGLYGDCGSVNDVGNLLLAAATITNEEVTNRQENTALEGLRASQVTTDQNAYSTYAPAANNIAVSTVNGSDSTSTAYDPDQTAMFALQGNYFAVIWTKSANIYISIFELTEQTSDVPTITRIIDTESLGAIPADSSSTQRLSGTAMGTGVALITCGNYYKFIKVPI